MSDVSHIDPTYNAQERAARRAAAKREARREGRARPSSEYGWLVIRPDEYEKMVRHDYAGPEPGGTCWVLAPDATGATCLWTGVQILRPEDALDEMRKRMIREEV